MSSLAQLAANNAKYNSTQDNQRGAAIVRVCGEEHVGIQSANANIFFLPHDNDMCFISDYKFKFILGNGGVSYEVIDDTNTEGGQGTVLPSGSGCIANTPAGWGTKIYSSANDFLNRCGPGTVWDMDKQHGAQCWDYACMFWTVMANRWLVTTPKGGVAAQCWNVSRSVNAGTEFDTSNQWSTIRRGDWLFWDAGPAHPGTGHVAIAIASPEGNYVETYAQNVKDNNGDWMGYCDGGTYVVQKRESNSGFLGYFRFHNW